MGDGWPLEVERLLELDAVADVTVGEFALVDDAAGALNGGTRAAGKIGRHSQREGKSRADFQGQRTLHKEAGAGNIRRFRSQLWLGCGDFLNAEAERDLQRLPGTDTFL